MRNEQQRPTLATSSAWPGIAQKHSKGHMDTSQAMSDVVLPKILIDAPEFGRECCKDISCRSTHYQWRSICKAEVNDLL